MMLSLPVEPMTLMPMPASIEALSASVVVKDDPSMVTTVLPTMSVLPKMMAEAPPVMEMNSTALT